MAKVTYKGIADAKPPELVEDDEHQLRITRATYGPGKTDPTKFRTEAIIEVMDVPDSQGIFHYLGDPNPDGDEKSEKFKALMTKKFLVAFGIDFDGEGFELDDFIGKTYTGRTKKTKDETTGRESVNLVLPDSLVQEVA